MAQAPKGITHARPTKTREEKEVAKTKGKGGGAGFPSPFGSHAGMTNQELTGRILPEKQDAADPWIILTDERGPYATRRSRLDSGLADPQRCADQSARESLVVELTGGAK